MFLAGCGLTTNPAKAAPEQWVEEPGVSAKAQELYSTPDIESAYATITAFALERGFDPALMDPQQTTYTAEQLNAGLLGRGTPAFQARWVTQVDSALQGNVDDQDGVRILQFFKWDQPTWKIPPNGRHVLNQWIRNAEIGATLATVDTPLRLKVTFVHQAGVRYLEDGVAFDLDVAKRVSYWLLPNPGGNPAWLIDEYEGEFAVGKDLPVMPENQTTAVPTPTASPFYTPAPTSVAVPNTGVAPAQKVVLQKAPANKPATRWPVATTAADAPPVQPRVVAAAPKAVTIKPVSASTTAPDTQAPATTKPPVTQPPVTQPPVTQPPVTQPPVTQPPVTQPPVTQPPVTQPPVTQPPVTQPPVKQDPPAPKPAEPDPPAPAPAPEAPAPSAPEPLQPADPESTTP